MVIVERDATTAQRMVTALGGHQCLAKVHSRRVGDTEPLATGEGCSRSVGEGDVCCVVLGTLHALYGFELERVEMVICAADLPDGSGLLGLDYMRSRAPEIPVILVGAPDDAAIAVEAIQAGAMDFLTTTGHDLPTLPLVAEKCLAQARVKQENERLHADLSSSLTELAVKNRQLQALVRQLEAMARTDDVTGLCNRRSLNETLESMWRQEGGAERPLAFMMIDLDDFKAVNDKMGHQHGDDVLRRIGQIIQANCRQVDVAARYGGDEFCVLMPDCDAAVAVRVAHRIQRALEKMTAERPEGEPRIGMSIGVAHTRLSAPADTEELVHHADEALYAAKSSGKGRVMSRDRNGVQAVPALPLQGPIELRA